MDRKTYTEVTSPKSCTSANSAIPACLRRIVAHFPPRRKAMFCAASCVQQLLQTRADQGDQRVVVGAVGIVGRVAEHGQILGEVTLLEHVQSRPLQAVGEAPQRGDAVQLAPLAQGARPGEHGGQRVGGDLLTPPPAVEMIGDGAVGGLVLKAAVRGHQHAGHHGQGAGGGGDKVAHHVAVVVLARPDHAALTADDLGGDVVDKSIAVVQPGGFKGGLVLLVIDLLEQQLERLVVVLGDGILHAEPHVLLHGQGVGEAAAGEGEDGVVPVVHGLHHAGAFEIIDGLAAELRAVLVRDHQFGLGRAGYPVLHRLVQIAVGVAGDGHRLFPAGHHRPNAAEQDGRAEHGAVQRRPDGGVGGFPQLAEAVLLLPLEIGGDGGAFHAHLQTLDGVRGLAGHGVLRPVPVGQGQVVILRVQLHEGLYQLFLDHAPQDVGHLVAVQLGDGVGHSDLIHGVPRSWLRSS